MSVDFYVAMPAANWPTAAAIQKCMVDRSYPVQIKRFPLLDGRRVVTDGILASIDDDEAYLQGQLAIATAMAEDVDAINGRLSASGSPEKVKPNDVMVSFHVASPGEMRAVSS